MPAAHAQQAQIDEIIVTGSRTLERTALTTPAPVDQFSAADLDNTAQVEAGRAIQALAPAFNFPSTSIADGTDALKPATLRGLGPDQTLVLINGKRRHKSALVHINSSVGRGTAGTDMNALAPSFIGKVEILRDGAAALYGSDAIAGVINLGLREESDGEVIISSGVTTEGDGMTVRYALNRGFTNNNNDFLFVGYEHRDRERTNRAGLSGTVLYSGEAGISDPATCNANANSGCDPREFTANRNNFNIGDPESVQEAAVLHAGTRGRAIDWRGFITYSERDNQSTGFFREPDDANRNVVAIYPDGFLPEINTQINDLSYSLEVSSTRGDWDWDLAYTYGENEFDFHVTNSLNASFGATSPTSADSGGFSYEEEILNFNLRGAVGDIALALGAEAKTETYEIRAGEVVSYIHCRELPGDNANCDNSNSGGIQVFPGFRPESALSEDRDSTALYAEASREYGRLLANAALRWEDYDGFGDVLVGKLGGYLPLSDTHAVRGTISTGFRAPSVHQLYLNSISTQFVDDVALETITARNDSALARNLGVPILDEETSVNFGVGYVYTPASNFSLTLDYYRIDIDDRIILSGQVNPTNLSPAVQAIFAAEGVRRAQFFINGPDTETTGFELVAEWTPEVRKGVLDTRLAFSFTDTDVAGTFAPPGLLSGLQADVLFSARDRDIIEVWQPDSRVTLSADYHIADLTISGAVNRYGSYISSENAEDRQKHDDALIADLRVHWQIDETNTISLLGDNIFDEYPEENEISSSRGGAILGIVNSRTVFRYSRRTAPYGFNGAYWGLQWRKTF